MTAQELIDQLKTLPPHTSIGAYNADAGEVADVTGFSFDPGETEGDHYIEPSAVLHTDEL